MASVRSMSTGRPAKCTGMMARVRGVIAASTWIEIEIARVEVHIDEHRPRAHAHDDVRSRHETSARA